MGAEHEVPDNGGEPAGDEFPATSPTESTTLAPLAEEPLEGGHRDTDAVLHELTEAVAKLRDEFHHSMHVSAHHRTLIDKLHDENEQLRRVELERARDPVVRDLIFLADTCLRNGRAWAEHEAVTPDDINRVLQEVAGDVALILERQGVETFQPATGATFDRREARAVRSAHTPDAALDGTVAEVLKPGYRMGNRVLRYCEVVVWTSAEAAPRSPALPPH